MASSRPQTGHRKRRLPARSAAGSCRRGNRPAPRRPRRPARRTVASAAPFMPQWKTKRKIGASTALSDTLMSMVSMAILGFPSPRIMLLSPKLTIWKTEPSTMTLEVVAGIREDAIAGAEEAQQGIQPEQAQRRSTTRRRPAAGRWRCPAPVRPRALRFSPRRMEIKAAPPKPTNMPSAISSSMKGKATVMPATAGGCPCPADEDAVDEEVERLGHEADDGRGGEFQQQRGDVLLAQPLGSIHDGGRLPILRERGLRVRSAAWRGAANPHSITSGRQAACPYSPGCRRSNSRGHGGPCGC